MAAIARDNAADYRRQLLAYAMKIAKDEGVAEDLVQWAFCAILESDAESVDGEAIYYLCRMVHTRFMAVRSGKSQLALQRWRQVSGESTEEGRGFIQKLSTRANHQERAELSEALRLMAELPTDQSDALSLRAMGYDDTEIAAKLGCTRATVRKRSEAAQEFLCRASGRPPPNREWSKSGYRGVSRHGDKWKAEQQSTKLGRLYLGLFDTAEEAALAFDMAALARLGDKATLNFPELRDELRQRLAA